MPGTVKSGLLPDADRLHKCDGQEKVCKLQHLPLDKSHFITDFQILLGLTYRADVLSLHEIQTLDEEEFRTMISNSESLHSCIYALQNELDKIKDEILQNENITKEQKKNFFDFLEFMPNDNNIVLLDNDIEESNVK